MGENEFDFKQKSRLVEGTVGIAIFNIQRLSLQRMHRWLDIASSVEKNFLTYYNFMMYFILRLLWCISHLISIMAFHRIDTAPLYDGKK